MDFVSAQATAFPSSSTPSLGINVGTGKRRHLYVGITCPVIPTSVKYAGFDMTLVNNRLVSTFYNRLYRILNPTQGSNTINIVLPSTTSINIAAAAYENGPLSNFIDGETTNTGNATNLTTNYTVKRNNSLIILYAKNYTDTLAAGSGLTLRSGAGNTWGMFDSNGGKAPGSHGFQTTGTATQNIVHNLIAIKPFAPPSGFLSF